VKGLYQNPCLLIIKIMKLLKKLIDSPLITPLLFAIFPILSLWATNFSRIDAQDVLRPLLEAILAALVIYFILKWVLRDGGKAGLLSTLVLFLYFSYGHIFAMIRGIPDLGLTRNRIMGPLWLLALLAGGFLIVKFGKKISGLIPFLNYTGLALLVLAGFQLGYAHYQELSVPVQTVQAGSIENNAFDLSNAGSKEAYPDIYLILLDSYARPDTILQSFKYDDTAFVQALTQMGFTVPKCSMSNYAYTAFSMSSMLNMNYLEAFYPKIDPQRKVVDRDWATFTNYIRYSQVRKNLTDLGYKTVSFEAEYPWVEIPNADIFYSSQSSTKALLDFFDPTDFDDELSQTTVLKIIEDRKTVSPWLSDQLSSMDEFFNHLNLKAKLYPTNNKKYDRVLSSFNQLEGLGKVPGPKFVYLHSTALHPNFVFGPNGQYKLSSSSQGYIDTLAYLNKRMLEILPILIRDSKVPPIIILMGDHGLSPGTDTRLDNFSAFYMPGKGSQHIYPSITPVNIFRIIFNNYFNSDYQLLPDKSFNFDDGLFFNFRQIPPSCPK
jgi:hypothetical protein